MKIIQSSIITLLISSMFIACNYLPNNNQVVVQDSIVNDSVCKPYFEFDEIEFYTINVFSDTLATIALKENRIPQDTLFEDILTLGHLTSLQDSIIVNQLVKLGFKKLIMPDSTHQQMREIFCERKHDSSYAYSCIPLYRDIFVFRQNGRISGIAKICFGCKQSTITGTNCNTEDFGQSGDFDKLKEIVRPLWRSCYGSL